MTVKNTFLEIIDTDMTVQKGFFENYRGGHDVWADMTTENTVFNGKKYKNFPSANKYND